jgi:hypothetical protein
MSILSLPLDVLSNVLALIPAPEVSRLRFVCIQLNVAISQESSRTNPIWGRLCYTAGFRALTSEELKAGHTYRRHFSRSTQLIPDLPYFHPVRKPVQGRVPRNISIEVLTNQAFENHLEVALCKIIFRNAPEKRPKKKRLLETYDSPMKGYVKELTETTVTRAALANYTRFLSLFLTKKRFTNHIQPFSLQLLFYYIPTSEGHLELMTNCHSFAHLAKKIPAIDLCEALFFAAAQKREDILRHFLETNQSSVETILQSQGDLLHRLNAVPTQDFDGFMQMLAPLVARRFYWSLEPQYNRFDIYEIFLADRTLQGYNALHNINPLLTRSIIKGHQGCVTLLLKHPSITPIVLLFGLKCAIKNKKIPFAWQILENQTALRQLPPEFLLKAFNYANKYRLPDIAERIRSLF